MTFEELKNKAKANWNYYSGVAEFKLNQVKNGVKDFCTEHPEVAIPVAVTIAGGVVSITKNAYNDHRKSKMLKKEEDLKNNYVYDNRMGRYIHLRRQPSEKEWAEISSRRSNGEYLGDILYEMHLS